jgi:hypothetical protein
VVTRVGTGRSHVRITAGSKYFSILHNVHSGSGALPVSYSIGIGESFPGLRRPEREVYHSLLFSVKVKNEYTSYLESRYITLWNGQGQIYFLSLCYQSLHSKLLSHVCRASFLVPRFLFDRPGIPTSSHGNRFLMQFGI